jgi:predicted GH43/DUF377 family glycosyl hydrolase
MKWVKKGLILEPTGQYDWMVTHASMPCAERIGEDLYRIYFCGRNSQSRVQTGYIEIDINEPQKILSITEKPVLGLGSLGAFDDTGVWPAWIVDHDSKKYLYYNGRMAGVTVPFYSYIGLAISRDGGKTFERFSKTPILERNDYDPYMTQAPCVIIENAIWRMWYGSVVGWEIEDGKPKHYYHIKYAESKDGINWERNGVVCIDFKSKDEYAISRPCVVKEGGIYKMWYSYRGESYRIGYAESKDGIHWERKDDQAGIDVSDSGWDSEMIEYAFVFEHKGKKYMLYNGNDYGKTGLGYAIMIEE